MIFRGYIDESVRQNPALFTLSCLMASDKSWLEMERSWKLCLAAKNKQLKKKGRKLLRRYHASDCNSRRKDFEEWSAQEQIEFVKGLLSTFRRTRGVHAVGYVLNLDELREVFPNEADHLAYAYDLLTKFMLQTIGDDFDHLGDGRPAEVTLFHDRTANGKYDGTIARAFDQLIADEHFKHAHYFTTIKSLKGEECVPLQPADLVAFEAGKYAEQQSKKRRSFEAMLDLPEFGIHVKMFTKEILQRMKQTIEERQSGS